jgi:hypothetical protein
MTLYDKLKPEIKDKLEANYTKYATSIDYIFNKLQTKDRYSELTIDDVKTLNTFADQQIRSIKQIDLMYGDHLFNN